jgi:hypothetical protein
VADNGGGDGADEELMRTVASLAANLDRAAAVVDRTWGGDLSWWMCVEVFGRWRGDGEAAGLQALVYRCCGCC